jgi:LysR family carnitine catabolism transcriptional activator
MDIKISQLEAFVAVSRVGSFTKAAELLHLSQPALTVQIKQLEECLGTRLIDRNTRHVTLTPVGRQFAPVVHRMLSEMESLVSRTRKPRAEMTGAVVIAAITSVAAAILPAAIAEFQANHPKVLVGIKDDVAHGHVLRMVREEKVDFGIAGFPDSAPDLDVSFFFRDRLCAVMARANPLARQRVIRLKTLATCPLIAMDTETNNRKLLDRAFDEMGYSVQPAYEVSRTTTAVALAEAGVGVAVLPASLFKGKKDHRFAIRPIQNPLLFRQICIIQKFAKPLSAEATAFLKCLKACRVPLQLDIRQPT